MSPKPSPAPPPAPFVAVSSGKGGVGKTSLALNLALAMAGVGRRILLVDGDLGLANIDVMLGLDVRGTIRDVLAAGGDPREVLVTPAPNLAVLPASSGVPDMAALGPDDRSALEEVLEDLAADHDLVLVDTAAGIGPSVLWFNAFADRNLLVLTPDPTSLTDAYALVKVLCREHHRRRVTVVANMVRDDREARRIHDNLARVTERFLGLRPELLGAVPRDPAVERAVRAQVPLLRNDPDRPAARAVRELAERILTWLPRARGQAPRPARAHAREGGHHP
ncbi:MinD/ParA family protein [Dissulfurirhabdus thermomarina]|uniref:MinD/ParA family protein n=1 Tax=Dissulfurirhabdus thermomarina TaxID=1765737 RepID=A0A6N9TQT7_DISTH|nr:MinD/ParA family protein [Dissulfurirhabdus thermomarina]NDY41807.1 MinD/ParA family protein [Dissulfurirhabdus thermomarina]NMX24052.1 MinD/ParA family protein [Dissulfurirhabdus thermomarina]